MREKDNIQIDGYYLSNRDANINRYNFPIENILNKKISKIVVKKIPEKLDSEKTEVFNKLLEWFNMSHKSNLSVDELLSSKSSFSAFMDFITYCILKGYLVIKEDQVSNFMYSLENLRKRYVQKLRSVEKYYDEILRVIYYPKGFSKKDEFVKKEMYRFEQAYSLMKLAFENEKRDSGERYFEHLKGVMEILLRELPNPNLDKIIIALLHDVQEDLPEYADVVRIIYGDYIANGVEALNKKDWKLYLNESEIKELGKCIDDECRKKIEGAAKDRRNEDYFGHLDNLNDDYLDVKLADRIHNLRDMNGVTRDKAIRKVRETEKYFLDIAKNRNPKAYELMILEVEKLKKKFEFNGEK